MYIVHGTWIPRRSDQFVQDGAFCLWVETDHRTPQRKRPHQAPLHPRHLAHDELRSFLADTLDVDLVWDLDRQRTERHERILLPTVAGEPLPSIELLPYMDAEAPLDWQLAPWTVAAYRLHRPIAGLNTIHFSAFTAGEAFQLGADLLFWWQYSQELKRLILADRYLPALRYRTVPAGDRLAEFEVYGSWELCSDAYTTLLTTYSAAMPGVCRAATAAEDTGATYTAPSILRHFSQSVLNEVVAATPITGKLTGRLAGTLLADAVQPGKAQTGGAPLLADYRAWKEWRDRLLLSGPEAGFTLAFRLHDAPPQHSDDWRLEFLVKSKHDPSAQLGLAEYWQLTPAERTAVAGPWGADFERRLLLSLGHAARIYPRVWDGLETDRPVGLQLTLEEAHAFLKEDAWTLEDAGYTVVVPSWWTRSGRRRARVRLTTTASGGSGKSYFSLDSVIAYQYSLSIDGQVVSEAEWRGLVEATTSLVQFRGQWMEVDREHMRQMLAHWEERQRTEPELTLVDLMRIAAEDDGDLEWEHDSVLDEVLTALQEKSAPATVDEVPNFHGTLREYQKRGVAWLQYLEGLHLNPCLADDMGLGKTVQIIAQLVAERNEQGTVPPTLLIAPTSVLGNWRKEIERFAPHLRVLGHHGPGRARTVSTFLAAAAECDVVITSFALARLDEKLLRASTWQRIVIDEAQNIKNPLSAQTRAIGKLRAIHRVALTGTPVENRLRDLWSIFHFLNPGYLGREAQFRKTFEIPIQRDSDPERSATLRRLVEPLILRRLKTDRSIIRDLPDKIEQKVYCNLTPEQASLYEVVVRDVETRLATSEGIERRGLILATLLKLKQVCNHPAQFLHDGSAFSSERSRKLERLTEMVQESLDAGDSVLIFTQFTEAGTGIERQIRNVLHCPTYYLHGGTPSAKREQMIDAFQDPDGAPSVFVLSVRAGGTGITLTRANHVFHFDRWWNPAVEDQATDRAFRIGQKKNVFVHKFVALGTVEERIDAMIEEKKGLAASIVGSDEAWLTELDNDAFRDLIALRQSALVE